MDPATLIVAALVQGILFGVQRATEHAVLDGYWAMRAMILRRYAVTGGPRLEETIDALEAAPTESDRQEAMARELERVGADQDPELQQLAEELTELIEDPMARLSGPVERAHRQSGARALSAIMDRHLGTVLRARTDHRVEDTDLLTTGLPDRTNVPQDVRDELLRLHDDVRKIIERIAVKIEDGNYTDAAEAIRKMPLSFGDRERATSLVNADRAMHVSYQTLRTTVEYFSELNDTVLERIDRERSPDREANMMLGNAIMIYELTEFVIRSITEFGVAGVDEIERVHGETRKKIAALREQQQDLERRANTEGIEEAVRRATLEDVRNRAEAIDELEREWAKYLGEVAGLRSLVDEVRAKVPTLELIRDNARVQIGVLQLVAMLRFLKQNADAIKGTIDTLKGFRLAPLSSNRVRRLIGV